jgi:hypothetical protein
MRTFRPTTLSTILVTLVFDFASIMETGEDRIDFPVEKFEDVFLPQSRHRQILDGKSKPEM